MINRNRIECKRNCIQAELDTNQITATEITAPEITATEITRPEITAPEITATVHHGAERAEVGWGVRWRWLNWRRTRSRFW